MQMILEFEENPFNPGEDQLLVNVREPEHEEAVKALLAGKRQRFLDILVKNNLGLFSLSPRKVTAESLNVQESDIKQEFDKLFNSKFSEALIDSQEGQRFFESPAQISLHNYAKQQYLEDKNRLKIDESIINAYKNIFKRIVHVDDFVYFIDFCLHAFVRQPFDFVEAQCREILLGNEDQINNLEITKNIDNFNDEEKLIIRYCLFTAVDQFGKKSNPPSIDSIRDLIKHQLSCFPYKKLVKTCLFLNPFPFTEKILGINKHPRQFIEYDFKNNQCRLKCDNLHPDLRGHQTFSNYFKKLKYMQQLVEKYEIIAHSAVFQDNKLLLGLNFDLLSYDVDIGYEYTLKISNKTISEYIDFLSLLTKHISTEFVAIQEHRENNKYYNIMYACKAFELFVSLNKLRNTRSQIYVIEHLVSSWARNFSKWISIPEIKNERYFQKALQCYFYLFSCTEREEEFPNLGTFESELSKSIFELLVKLESYPCETDCFKGIKSIIFKWSLQIIPQSQQLKDVISKMMSCYFSDKLTLKILPKELIFQTPAICKVVKKFIGVQIMEHLNRKYQRIQNDQITNSSHPLAKNHANFFPKLGYIISSRIMGQAVESFAFIIMKCYLNYAHVWPIIHSFRMWILQVCKDNLDNLYLQKAKALKQLLKKLIQQILSQVEDDKEGWSKLSQKSIEWFREFTYTANLSINYLRMKKNKNILSVQIYQMYLSFMIELEEMLNKFKSSENQSNALKQWLIHDCCIQKGLESILQEFKMTFRYWLCNSVRFLHIQEEEAIMSCIGRLISKNLETNKTASNDYQWKFICDIMGINDIKIKSSIATKQIMGPLQKYTARLNNRLQDYIPFNFAASLYSSIRPQYKNILRAILTSLLADSNKKELWLIAEKLMFPAVLISGPCIFNGQTQEKTKEDMAFGLFYDQFQKITKLLTEPETMLENIKILVMLEKRKVFSKFYDIIRGKNAKIVERLKSNPPENRFRGRPMQVEDVITSLAQMGVSRQEAEIALENIEYPDNNLAMDWIDNNQQRLDEIILNRTMERTRHDIFRRQSRKEPEVAQNQDQILPLSFDRFYDKEKLIKQSRSWIKVIFKEIFKQENMSESQTLKDILFLFMDSLKSEDVRKQYNYLNDKLYKDIDALNNVEDITSKIVLLLNILEGAFSKTENAKTDFYQKSINLKILSYLSLIKGEDAITRVFSLLNSTLPVFSSSDNVSPDLQNYLCYLLDVILQYRIAHKSQTEIMLKIAKLGKSTLMQRITRNLTIFSKEKLIKESIFSLINMILESDKQLSLVNAQLDLKTFLYQRYKHRISSFLPDKQHVLEIDIKEFSVSFPKYDKGSSIYEVSKQMLSKKKNKNKLLFYDCRKQKNAFDHSHFGQCTFLAYPIKEHFKTMIKSLLSTLFESSDEEAQQQMLTDLHKLLLNFRILLPFTVYQQIGGKNLLEWLLFSPNISRRKFKFLTFLTLNSNILVKRQNYNFISLSDYICARIIKSIMNSSENTIWSSFGALYLSQVRKFSQYCTACFSKERDITLVQYYENIISKADPLEYLTISQFLYIQYKRKMLDNLRRKYKFTTSPQESSFDRQFLNISPFFNSLAIKKNQKNQKHQLYEMIESVPDELDEEDDDSSEMVFLQESQRIMRGREIQRESQVEQLIVPLPIPQPKEENDKEKQAESEMKQEKQKLQPIVINNCQYLEVILEEFEKYLNFEQQISEQFDVKESTLPQKPIEIPNFNNGFKVKVEDIYVDIDMKVKKLTGFEKRIAEIYTLLNPKKGWEVKKQPTEDRQAFVSLGRRLIQSLNNPMAENNRDTLLTLERLIHGRYHREEAANQPPTRSININDIYQHLEEFTEPIVPVVIPPEPEKKQAMEIEQPGELNNKNDKIENQSEKIQIEQPQNVQQQAPKMVEEPKQEQGVPLEPKQELNQAQPQPEVVLVEENVQVAEKMEEQKQEPQQINEGLIEQPLIPPLSPLIEIETIIDPNNHGQIRIAEQHPHENGENIQPNLEASEVNLIDPVPVSNVQNNQPPAQVPPARERQILRMLGLPQTFLRDVGLDQQFFDSLPEDLQQEQLMTFMAQQGARLNVNPGANNNPNQPNQPQDLQSENIAFLQSLDPQTRAQVLLEATPQFLATLPPNIRQEAERYRNQQINRMIEQEQIEQERTYIHNQKNKPPTVYPKVFRQQFSQLSQQSARQIFRGVFNLYPKLKLSALKILLQNKHTQEKTIASIIALIYSFDEKFTKTRRHPINRIELENKEVKTKQITCWNSEEMSEIRVNVLHTVLEHLKIPLYKDEDFLKEDIKTDVYLEELSECLQGKETISPLVELISFSLNYYSDLATQLLKRAKDLPDELFQKIVEGIRKEQWPSDFYDSLANFSQNERLQQIFSKQFEVKAPKIQILGKLLKYKFAHLSSLKKIHQDALEYYSASYLQFLNQIFSIYTLDTLGDIQPLLKKYKQIHYEVIKHLYQSGKELEKEPIGLLLKKPQLLDFETKKFIFRNHPKLRRQSGRRIHIEVDRTHLFQGSYNQLMSRTVKELEGRVQVAFINEPGYDAGGLKRQWFLLVSREIFNQDYALFEKSSSGSTYQPNPKSYVNPDHLNYFKFIGRFIGKALVERQLIDAYFTRAFYKMILGQQLQFKDLEAQDYDFYKSMEWLKNNPIDQNTFTFSYIYDNFGNKIEKELVPGGKQIVVNEENKLDYIEKYCMSKMRDDFSTQINKFLQGFRQIVPQECISYFEAKELELLISGVPEVDVEDLKRNTDYSGYNPTDQIIVWFWEVVSEYSQEDLAKLVQFITGTSKIPVEGFSHMIGMNGIQRISIHRDPCDHQLPKAHTCFNQLDLPNYHSKEILKQKLGICLAWGSQGFGFM